MKRSVAFLLALTVLLGASSALALEFDTSKGYPVVSEPVTLKIFAKQHIYQVDYAEMPLWQDYEEMTGVHVEWELVPTASFDERRNLKFAANELPDAFYIAGLTNNKLVEYAEQGLLCDISQYLDYMPNLKRYMDASPAIKAAITSPDGAIYSTPGLFDPEFTSVIMGPQPYLRTAWLEKLGLAAPHTLEEFEAVFDAFKAQDADGDGDPNNEIPCASIYVGLQGLKDFVWQFYGAFGLGNLSTMTHPYLQEADGKLVFLPATDEYKEMLTMMQRWWQKGYFDKELLTIETAEMRSKMKNGQYGFISTFSESNFNQYTGALQGTGYIEGPGGKTYTNTNSPCAQVGTFVVTADCKYPELICAWIDWFYSDEGIIKYFLGTEGETFDIIDGEYVYKDWVRKDPGGRSLDEMIGTFSTYPGGGAPRVVKVAFFSGAQKNPDSMNGGAMMKDYMLTAVPAFTYTADESETLTITSDLITYADNMLVKFITGAESLDNWDNYLAQMDKMGLNDYLAVENAAYQRYLNAVK